MAQQWRIRIRGNQRKDLDIDMLMQAVIALGQQLRDEQHDSNSGTKPVNQEEQTPEGGDA